MTKTIRFGAAGIAMFAALGMSSVAHADTATADATAEVLEALVLNNNSALDFGAMVVSAGGGSVSLAADGTLDCTAANIVCSGTTGIANFDVDGTANKDVTVNLPTGSVDLVHTGFVGSTQAEHVIVLGSFVSDATGGEVTLDATGVAEFNVGGTITLDGSEIAGIYEGTFTVSVEYS